MSPREHKIVVLGAMGAGKSTLVRALAGDRMVDTDVANTDAASDKLSTTVAMDYADIDLPNGDRLRLYGTPGQARFDFIWPVLLQGASGVLVLADASVPAFVADLDRYLRTLRDHAPDVAAAIGVSKLDLAPHADIDALATRAMDLLRALPVVPFDPRSDAAVMMLMDVLMSEIEAMDLVGSHG
ncbi:small GTP-binding protein [Pseudoxanthomonas japonensis]|uniref:GTP-binding protein n=1 Tax=Pseudoxanthomonas TaxID=83618 RepID=UPI000B079B1A|nr:MULTISPECIES: GTPase [Pseudoxanthomonas]MDR7068749.1 small GTP-binding protein [Pseudoxanthomonas japonensis]